MLKVQRITLIVPFDDEDGGDLKPVAMPSEWDWSTLIDSAEPVIVVDASVPEVP